jgi:hypothetical protein
MSYQMWSKQSYSCQLSVFFGHCIQNGTIVACHSNQSKHGKGMGIKAPDSLVVALCHTCHHELDNGNKLSKEERRHLWDQAYIKTMQYLIEKELLIINEK